MSENCDWNSVADYWQTKMGSGGDWFQKYIIYPSIQKILNNNKNSCVLDIGCGNGHLTVWLKNNGFRAKGIDCSKKMIEYCKSKISNDDTFCVENICGDSINLSNIYDAVIFNNSIQDIEDYQKALKNANKLLKNNGKIIIITKHPCFHPTSENLGWDIIYNDKKTKSGFGLTKLLDYDGKFGFENFTMDNYFDCKGQTRTWGNEKTVSHRRTLSQYFQAISSSGFKIINIFEPTPIKEGETENQSLYNLSMRIPNFIIFEGEKYL